MDNLRIIISAILDKVKTRLNIKNQLTELSKTPLYISIVGRLEAVKTKSQLKKQVNEISKQLNSIVLNTNVDTKKIKTKLQTAVKDANTIINVDANVNGGEKLDEVGNKLDRLDRSSLKSAASMLVLYKALHALEDGSRKMVETAISLDDKITAIRMTTGDSYDDTMRLVEAYNILGRELGATTAQVLDASTEWLRQGKTAEETAELVKQSVIFSKVGMVDAETATKNLTSAMKGYGYEVKDVAFIVDQLTAIDMKAAVTASDLAESMSRTAASAKLAGVDFNKLLGYLTITQEVSQKTASTIGESYKTIFQRMGNIKIGKFIDNEGNDLNDVEKTLKHFGIALRDTKDNFREFDDVLSDVGSRWKDFTNVEQHAISTAFAGVRQQENFLILMENWSTALNYAEVAADSAGTSLQKFNVYQESITFSINEFISAFEQFSMKSLDSQFIKDVISAGGTLLDVLDNINNLLLIVLGTTLIIKRSKIASGITGIVSSLSGVYNKIAALIPGTQAYAATQAAANSTMATGAVTAKALSGGIGALMLIISGISMAVSAYNEQQEAATRKAVELSQELNNQVSSLDELRAKIKDESTSRESLINLMSSHNEKYGEEFSKITDVNEARQRAIDLIDEEAKKKAQETIRETGVQYAKQKDFIENQYVVSGGGFSVSYDNPKAYFDELQKMIDSANSRISSLSDTEKTQLGNLQNQYTELKKKIEEATIVINGYEASQSILNGTYVETAQVIEDANDSTEENISSVNAFAQNLSDLTAKTSLLSSAMAEQSANGKISRETYEELYNKGEDYRKFLDILGDDYVLVADSAKQFGADLIKQTINTAIANGATEEQISVLKELLGLFDDVDSIKVFTSSLKSLSDQVTTLKDVQEDLNNGNGLTAQNYEKLLTLYPSLEQALSQYILGLISEKELQKEIARAEEKKRNEIEETAKYTAVKALEETQILAEAYGINLDNFTTVEELKNAVLASSTFEQWKITDDNVDKLAELYGIDLENYKDNARKKVAVQNAMIDEVVGNLRKSIEANRANENDLTSISDMEDMIKTFENQKISADFADIIFDPKSLDLSKYLDTADKKSKSTPLDKLLDTSKLYNEQLKDLEKNLDASNDKIIEIQSNLTKAEAFGDENEIKKLNQQLIEAKDEQVGVYETIVAKAREYQKEIKSTFSEFANIDMSDYGIAKYRQSIQNEITSLQNVNAKTDNENIKRNNEIAIQGLETRLSSFNEYAGAIQSANDQEKKGLSEISKLQNENYIQLLKMNDEESDKRIKNLYEVYEKTSDETKLRKELVKLSKDLIISETQRLEILEKIKDLDSGKYERKIADIEYEESFYDDNDFDKHIKSNKDKIKVTQNEINRLLSKEHEENSDEVRKLNQDIFSYEKEILENTKQKYEARAKVVIATIEEEIKTHEKLNKELTKEKEALEKIKSQWEATISYAVSLIDDQIDGIEKLNDALSDEVNLLEKTQSNWEKSIGAATNIIDEQIKGLEEQKKALKEVNDEKDREIKLEELKKNLEKANQRTNFIYRDGQFVYEKDQQAIDDAQKALDDFYSEDQIRAIDKQIEAWEKQKDTWNSLTSDIQKEKDNAIAEELLGSDYAEKILNMQAEDLLALVDSQYRANDALIDTKNKEIEANNDKIKSWNEYKEVYTSVISDIERENIRLQSIEATGYDISHDILVNRKTDLAERAGAELTSLATQIKVKDDEIEANNKRIESLGDMKTAWSDFQTEYDLDVAKQKLGMGEVARLEKIALDGRVKDVKKFVSDYNKEMAKLATTSATLPTSTDKTSSTSTSSSSTKTSTATTSVKSGDKVQVTSSGNTENSGKGGKVTVSKDANALISEVNPNSEYPYHLVTPDGKSSIGWFKEDDIKKYSQGGVVDYDGIAEVHGGKSSEMILNNTDVAKTYDLIHTSDELGKGLKEAAKEIKDATKLYAITDTLTLSNGTKISLEEMSRKLFSSDFMQVSSYNVQKSIMDGMNLNRDFINSVNNNSTQSGSVTIGEIHVHEVQDVDGFSNAIERHLPNKMLQATYNRF